MEYVIKSNEQFKSNEIYFKSKPSEAVREALKALKFRWHGVKKCWYGFADAEQIKKAINEEPTPIEFEKVEEGTIYEGWQGNRCREWHSVEELKTLLQIEFKKKNYKISIRQKQAGYLTALHFTIKLTGKDIKPFEKWKEENGYRIIPASKWLYYTDESGKLKDIYGEAFYSLDPNASETKALKENILYTSYNLSIKHLQNCSCGLPKTDALTEEAAAKLKDIENIVASFNHDQSNSMIDYFDRDIYDDYSIKFTA